MTKLIDHASAPNFPPESLLKGATQGGKRNCRDRWSRTYSTRSRKNTDEDATKGSGCRIESIVFLSTALNEDLNSFTLAAMSSEKTTNEEEKKHEELGGFESKGEDEDKDEDKDETDDEVTLLTPQLASIFGDHSFGTEDSLHQFMDEKGIGDLRIVLVDGKPRLVMPTDQHNSFTSKHVFEFAVLHGKWGYVSGTHNVHLSTYSRREPDVSFFGYVRCMRNKKGVLELKDKGAVPDVIIQFSWKNKKGYGEDAMDDMMNLSLENERGNLSRDRPRVGYLIKVRFSKKRPLPGSIKGTNTPDLELPIHWTR